MEDNLKKIIQPLKDEITNLKNLINKFISQSDSDNNSGYESSETQDLNAALSKAYSEYKKVAYNRVNPYYKSEYADLEIVMSMVRPILATHGLTITQRTILDPSGATILQTRLWHATGQWIETRARINPSKNDYHTYGSALSYMKRYQIMALLNITIANDVSDDDAELQQASSREIFSRGTALSLKYKGKKESEETITKEQLDELVYELKDFDDIAEEIMDKLRLQSLADIPKSKFHDSLKRVREIINIREGRGKA